MFKGATVGTCVKSSLVNKGEDGVCLRDGLLSKEVIVLRFYHGILFIQTIACGLYSSASDINSHFVIANCS